MSFSASFDLGYKQAQETERLKHFSLKPIDEMSEEELKELKATGEQLGIDVDIEKLKADWANLPPEEQQKRRQMMKDAEQSVQKSAKRTDIIEIVIAIIVLVVAIAILASLHS